MNPYLHNPIPYLLILTGISCTSLQIDSDTDNSSLEIAERSPTIISGRVIEVESRIHEDIKDVFEQEFTITTPNADTFSFSSYMFS